ncbi:type VII secretion system-associated protein [Streptomyces argenteolus]|uniref:Type VII secretion system-associated protein n=1 Tax=Streptomyces argenteolus TaxID=67274 RepID=A0ABW6X789_9ACTN
MANTTILNAAWLKKFKDGPVHEFVREIDRMTRADGSTQPIEDVASGIKTESTIDTTKPLIIGTLAKDDSLSGGKLNSAVQSTAEALAVLLRNQKTLFDDIDDAMAETITQLTKAQQDNLAKMTGEEFLNLWEDVDGDLSGGRGSAGGQGAS